MARQFTTPIQGVAAAFSGPVEAPSFVSNPITLTPSSGTITPNAATGSTFRCVATADVTLAEPIGGVDGQAVVVAVQASGAARTLTVTGVGTVNIPVGRWWVGELRYDAATTTWLLDDTAGQTTITTGGGGVSSVNTRTGDVTGLAEQSALTAHATDTTNPHAVTKTQVGLGNVDNTADTAKPVSTATATALANKAPQLSEQSVKTSAYTAAAGELVPINTTVGAVTVTLPAVGVGGTSPVTIGTRWETGANAAAVATTGTDVLGSGTATSTVIPLTGETITWQSIPGSGRWRAVGGFKPTSSLDTRYAAATHTHGVDTLTATGTKDATTFLRGDNTWAAPAGGGGGGADTAGRNVRTSFQTPRVNDWVIQPAATMNSPASTNANMLLGWMFLPVGTYTGVGVHINNGGSAGSVIRFVAYNDDNGRPGTLAVDCGTVAATSAGFISLTTGWTLTVPAGGQAYWVGAIPQGAPTTSPTIFTVNSTGIQYSTPSTPLLWNTASPSFSENGITGAAPSTTAATASLGHPRLAFRRTA